MRRDAVGFRVPTESEEQQALFRWAELQAGAFPELKLLYHIPNGGHRYKSTAGRLRAEGVKAGVPDICLPVSRGGFHGLYIELKRTKGNRATEKQEEWIVALTLQGYMAVVCLGWEPASRVITDYLNLQGHAEKER